MVKIEVFQPNMFTSTNKGRRGEIEAAKKNLALAKKWEASAAAILRSAREEAKSARHAVDEAEEYLKSLEQKWEDGSMSSPPDAVDAAAAAVNDDAEDISYADYEVQLTRAATAVAVVEELEKSNVGKQEYVVEGCGVGDINGIYKKCGGCNGFPKYSNNKHEILCMKEKGQKFWYIRQSRSPKKKIYKQDVVDSDTPPKTNWHALLPEYLPPPFITPKIITPQDVCNNMVDEIDLSEYDDAPDVTGIYRCDGSRDSVSKCSKRATVLSTGFSRLMHHT